MKKLFLIGALIFGTVAASQAGVRLSVGVGVPSPGVVTTPAPYYYQAPPPVYYTAPQPYYYPAPVYSPPVVTVAPPSLYLGFGPFWGGHGHDHGHAYYGHGYGFGHGGHH